MTDSNEVLGPSNEVVTAAFGDARLTKRLGLIMDSLAPAPNKSFPDAMGNDAALEATYRFLNNSRVTPERILAPHIEATRERIARIAGTILVVHDTTEFEFEGESVREGLGRLRTEGQGFYGHFGLAVDLSGQPLGVVGLSTIVRSYPAPAKRRSTRELRDDPNKESKRWETLSAEVCARLNRKPLVVHVMDREADAYELLASLTSAGRRFVIRSSHDRMLAPDDLNSAATLRGAVESVQGICEREVKLSRRSKARAPIARKTHPPRSGRLATLQFSATKLTIKRPESASSKLPADLQLHVVRVFEPNPPEGEGPVEWRLLTREPIASESEVEAIVDMYRMRWVIEEFFKALKTGCSYERRQLESKAALLNALAVFVPIAWSLLTLRTLARRTPEAPAKESIPARYLQVLRAVSKLKLSEHPTVREAMLAIAALGGHIKNNGDPGWQVLGRGYERLLVLELGWQARSEM